MQLDFLKIDDGVEQNEDFLPGGNFTLDTGMYPMVVDMAFIGESKKGAASITVHFKEVGGKRTHRETFYVTSGKALGRKNTYEKNGVKHLLPGMEAMNQLAFITTGKKLPELSPEEKTIKLWNFDERKELPTKVPALTQMIGETVLVAITKCAENKRTKVGDKYIDTNDRREFNEVGKFLHEDRFSVAEKIAGEKETGYYTRWTGSFDSDYVNDKYKAVAPGVGVEAASAEAATANKSVVDELFGDD